MRPHGHPQPLLPSGAYPFQLWLVMEGTVVQVGLGLCASGSANLHVQEVVHPGHNLDTERAHTLMTPAGCTHMVTFFPPPPAFTGCQSHTQEAQPPPDGRCAPGPPWNLFTSCSNKASPTGTQRGKPGTNALTGSRNRRHSSEEPAWVQASNWPAPRAREGTERKMVALCQESTLHPQESCGLVITLR